MNGGQPQVSPSGLAQGGWYADPWRRVALRFWSGTSWEPWASDGRAVWADALPVRRALDARDVAALRLVDEVFLPEAQARGLLTPEQGPLLRDLALALTAEAGSQQNLSAGAAPGMVPLVATPHPATATAYPTTAHPTTAYPAAHPAVGVPRDVIAASSFPPARTAVVAERATRRPSALAQWAERARVAVGSDLAVHGLAYLGVLLLFTGLFGLVAFAFADVTPALRPVAELAGAVVPFVAARVLLRHGAEVVGRSLEVVGGLLVVVMVITSLLDDFPVPPDLEGAPLRAVLVGACLAASTLCAVWTRTHRDSGLRYIVAPMLWFAAAMAAMGIGRPIPSGEAVAVPTSAQLSAMAVALVLSVAVARRWPLARLARPTSTAAIPGLVVIAVLTELTWAAEGWPPGAVAVTGAMVLLALLLLATRVPGGLVDVAAPLWWTLVAIALLPSIPGPVVAATAAAGFLLLLELGGARRRPQLALALPAVGLLVSASQVWAEPSSAVPVMGVLAAWAALRRTRPYPDVRVRGAGLPSSSTGWATVLDIAAAVLPALLAVAVSMATTPAVGVLVAAALVSATTAPALGHGLRRETTDQFWRRWWQVALPIGSLAAAAGWFVTVTPSGEWLVATSVLGLTVSALWGPLRPAWRPWAVTLLATGGWVMVATTGGFPTAVLSGVPGVAALAMVVVAHLVAAGPNGTAKATGSGPDQAAVPTALGFAGHALALVALGLAGDGWDEVAMVALATAGLALTAVAADRGRSPVGAALARVGGLPRALPWLLTLVGVPWAVWRGLGQGSAPVTASSPWAATALLGTVGLVYAAATYLPGPTSRAVMLARTGFAGALLGVVVSDRPWAVVGALGAVIATVVILPPARRAAPMRWTAWAALAPFLGLLTRRLVPWFADLPWTTAAAGTLVVVGGVLVVATVAVDTATPVALGRRWVARRELRRPALGVALAVGAIDVVLGLGLSAPTPVVHAAVLILVVSAIVLSVALLARAGALGGVAVVLAWFGAWSLARETTDVGPWLGVVVAAALLVLAEGLHRLPDRAWWSRWDIPVLVAAAPVAMTAVVGAVVEGGVVVTFVTVGLMTVAVAVRLRRRPIVAELTAWSGTVLVLAGASAEGAGWLALALLVLAAVHTGLALRATGEVRTARQVVGVVAALAAWFAALAWFAWSDQRSVDMTAVVAGAVVLLAAGAARLRVDRSWVAVWGGAGVLVVGGATVASFLSEGGAALDVEPSVGVVAGLAAVAVATLTSATSLAIPALRRVGVVPLLATLLVGFSAAGATASTRVVVLSVLAAGLAVVTLAVVTPAVVKHGRAGVWVRPAAELGGAASLIAIIMATTPVDLALLGPAVAAAAVQAAAGGVALRSLALQVLAVALACGAWAAFVAQAGQRGPYWYTVAIGLALLMIVGLWRRDRRARSEDVAAPEVVSLEMVAIAFLVGAPFVLAVSDSIVHALVAFGLGLGVAGWGAATRVRRRVAAGAVVVLAALVVLVAVPLVALLPSWGGPGLWLMIAAIGLAAVLVATFVERGRTVARTTRARVEEVTVGWE